MHDSFSRPGVDTDGGVPRGPDAPGTGRPRTTLRPRGLLVLLAAAIVLPAATMAGVAWLSWRDAWTSAERELARSAEAAAEYALRVHGGHRLAGDVANDLLRDLSDEDIRLHERDLHEELARLLPRMPLVQTIAISDRQARLLLMAHHYPVPRDITLEGREWVPALRGPDAPPVHVSRVYVGMLNTPLFYAVSRRRSGSGNTLPPDAYDGAISISVDPNAIAAGFMALGGEPGDVTSLVRADGEVLVRTPGFDRPLPSIPAESALRTAAQAETARGTFIGTSLSAPIGRPPEARLIAFRRVSDLPLYATVARPSATILARWREGLLLQLAIGIPASLALAGLAWLALLRTRAAEAAEAALHLEATERAAAEARRAGEARFRGVFESRIVGMAVFDAASGRTLLANDRLLEMTGARRADLEAARWDWRRATPAEQVPLDEAAIAEARARGWWEPYEKEFLRPDGSRLAVRVSSAPLPGEPGRLVVLVQDISEQREAELRRDLLRQEVDHRAKNALATARAALRLTRATSIEAFIDQVDGRIGALAQAISLLAETGWRGAGLATLVRGALGPFLGAADEPRVMLEGPDLRVTAAAVQPLAMAVHELATNATKYGALSTAEGRITLGWSRTETTPPRLRLRWVERGGPRLAGPPPTGGFGTRVLDATVRRQLGGSVVQHWEAEGLVCEIELPASRVLAPTDEAA